MGHHNTHIRRRFKLWHWIVALLLLLFVLFRISGSLKLKKRLEVLRTRGYPVTLKELDRSYNIPQGAANAADVYLAAFSNYVEWDKDTLRALPIVGRASLPSRTQPLDASTRQLMEKFLSENEKTLSLLHKAASIEHCRYPIDLTKGQVDIIDTTEGPGSLASWFKDLRASNQLLRLETLSHCENQNPDKALESIRANFALAKFIGAPLLVHRLAHNSVRSRTYKSIERILNRMQLPDEQLLSLSELIKASHSDEGYRRTLVGEQCLGLHAFQGPVGQASEQLGSEGGVGLLILSFWKIIGLHYRGALGYIDIMQEYIDAVGLPPHERLLVFNSIHKAVHDGKRGGMITQLIMPALSRRLQLEIRCLAQLCVTQTALAVERYRLAEGHLPQSLANLVPTYLQVVPKDPFDGRNLRYRKLETGFVVYSVGEDLTDEGGAEQGKGKRSPGGKPAPWDVTFIVER
jgi:hypothetical protein